MKFVSVIFFLVNYTLVFSQAHVDLTKKEQKFVNLKFQEGLIAEALVLTDQDLALSGSLREGDRLFLLRQEDEVRGYLLSTRTLGRYDYFDYLLAYAPDLSVRGITITVYRSSHGAAVCQKKWLSQFEGYTGEDLTLGKEIDAVAGATISATSLVKDMKRCKLFMEDLKEEGIIQ